MLRKGKSELNRRGDNELVSKYALDLFGLTPNETGRSDYFFSLDAVTEDRSGYIAAGHCTCLQTGSVVLVVGSDGFSMVETLQSDGTTRVDTPNSPGLPLNINGLDLDSMEWRGLKMPNVGLFQGERSKYSLIPSSDPEICHVANFSSNGGIQIYCISNLGSIRNCFTRPLSKRKRLSKKNTLSYQISKAKETRLRPFRECAGCQIFVNPLKRVSNVVRAAVSPSTAPSTASDSTGRCTTKKSVSLPIRSVQRLCRLFRPFAYSDNSSLTLCD